MSLFIDMYGTCIDGLSSDERDNIDPDIFARIVRMCAGVAEQRVPGRYSSPEPAKPPATIIVRARLLRPGDCVWSPDQFDFATITDVQVFEHCVFVMWADGRAEYLDINTLRRIAVNNTDALAWSGTRLTLTCHELDQIAATFGTYRT